MMMMKMMMMMCIVHTGSEDRKTCVREASLGVPQLCFVVAERKHEHMFRFHEPDCKAMFVDALCFSKMLCVICGFCIAHQLPGGSLLIQHVQHAVQEICAAHEPYNYKKK